MQIPDDHQKDGVQREVVPHRRGRDAPSKTAARRGGRSAKVDRFAKVAIFFIL